MAYQTGTSTGPADLLDKLRLFLIDNGWTVNKWEDDDTKYPTPSGAGLDGDGKRLHVQKTATDATVMYFNLRSTIRGIPFGNRDTTATLYSGKFRAEVTGLCIYGSTGYDTGLAWDLQPGGTLNGSSLSCGVCMTELSTTAIPAYYFFQDGDTVIVVVEYTAGKFQWFAFGCLEKQGVYTGGQFFTGSLSSYDPTYQILSAGTTMTMFMTIAFDIGYQGNGAVYIDVDSLSGWRWSGLQGNTSTGNYAKTILLQGLLANQSISAKATSSSNVSFNGLFYTRTPNWFNGLAPLATCFVFLKRASANLSLLGWPKSIRLVNITNYNSGDELTFGSDTWKIFPEHSKSDADPTIGFAVKKVT